jgi:hypothetical protein
MTAFLGACVVAVLVLGGVYFFATNLNLKDD